MRYDTIFIERKKELLLFESASLQYEGRRSASPLGLSKNPQVQVFGFNAGLLSPERAFLYAHATRCAKRCHDCCRYRCDDLYNELKCFFLSHGNRRLMFNVSLGFAAWLCQECLM